MHVECEFCKKIFRVDNEDSKLPDHDDENGNICTGSGLPGEKIEEEW